MSNYKIRVNVIPHSTEASRNDLVKHDVDFYGPKGQIRGAEIVGLEYKDWYDGSTEPNTRLRLARHMYGYRGHPPVKVYRQVWYGGCGEGREYDTFEDAILGSLYDELQVNDGMKEGDTFEAAHPDTGTKSYFKVSGVHVVPCGKPSIFGNHRYGG